MWNISIAVIAIQCPSEIAPSTVLSLKKYMYKIILCPQDKFSKLTEAQSLKKYSNLWRACHNIISNLSWYKQQVNTLKGFKICDYILLISKQPFMLHIF